MLCYSTSGHRFSLVTTALVDTLNVFMPLLCHCFSSKMVLIRYNTRLRAIYLNIRMADEYVS